MKKTISNIVLIIVIWSVVIFSSCGKEESSPVVGSLHENKTETTVTNPFEGLGQIHNFFLTVVGREIEDSLNYYAQKIDSGAFTKQDMYALQELAKQCVINIVLNGSSTTDSVSFASETRKFLYLIDTLPNIDSGECLMNAPLVKTYLSIFDQRYASVLEFQNEISRRESALAQNLSTHIDSALLAAYTVLEYSVYYWYDAENVTSNPWHKYLASVSRHLSLYTAKEDDPDPDQGFWGKLWNKAKSIIGKVVKVATGAAAADGVGVGAVDYHASHVDHQEPDYGDLGNLATIIGFSVMGAIGGWNL